MTDNHAQAQFLGKAYKSDSYNKPVTVTADPLGQATCSTYF